MRLALVAAILIPALGGCTEAVLADGPSMDVLGIKLDSSVDDAEAALKAAVSDATLLPNSGTLSIGDFTSPTLQFSVDVVEGDLPPWKAMTPNRATGGYNEEYLTLLFGLEEPQRVIGIRRNKAFTTDQSPALAAFTDALIQKYGKPVFADANNMQWIYGASPKAASNMPGDMKYFDCSQAAEAGAYSLSAGNYQLQSPDKIGECGTFIQLRMSAQPDNPNLLGQFQIWMTDVAAMKASYDYIYKVLNDGAAGVTQTQTQNAAKPTL